MPYSVHSHHLNVGAGDAAIHLLVKDRAVATEKDLVEAAVLIDGGPDISLAIIKRTIEDIEGRYRFEVSEKGKLRFDSLVVTHWDHDHYEGVFRLLISDFREQTDPVTRSRLLKYDTDDKPLSILYMPYFNYGESLIKGATKGAPEFLWRNDPVTRNAPTLVDINKMGQSSRKKRDMPNWVKNFAILCCTTGFMPRKKATRMDGMIGRNFFQSGPYAQRSVPEIASITDPSEIITDDERPGLYCVGADSVVIGQNTGPSFPEDPLNPGFIDINSSPTNLSSIMCAVVNTSGRILHYTGGDAEFSTEVKLPAWMGSIGVPTDDFVPVMKLSHHGSSYNTPISFLDYMRPRNIIISSGTEYYHPSKLSMLLSLYQQPKSMFPNRSEFYSCICFAKRLNSAESSVSAKEYEVVEYIYASRKTITNEWLADPTKGTDPFDRSFVVCTAYPYWLQKKGGVDQYNDIDFNLTAFTSDEPPYRVFKTAFRAVWNHANLPGDKDMFIKYVLRKSDNALRNTIADDCTKYWNSMSVTDWTRTAITASTHLTRVTGSHVFKPIENEIVYYRYELHDDGTMSKWQLYRGASEPSTDLLYRCILRASRKRPGPRPAFDVGKNGGSAAYAAYSRHQAMAVVTPAAVVRKKRGRGDPFDVTRERVYEVKEKPHHHSGSPRLPSDFTTRDDTPGYLHSLSDAEPGFYIVASFYKDIMTPLQEGLPKVLLSNGTNIDMFVSSLETGVISLDGSPTPRQFNIMPVDINDDWFSWMTSNGLSARKMNCFLLPPVEDPTTFSVQGFDMTIQLWTLGAPASLQHSASRDLIPIPIPFTLRYSTQLVAWEFNTNDISPPGVLPGFPILVMGLDFSSQPWTGANAKWNLSQLAYMIQLRVDGSQGNSDGGLFPTYNYGLNNKSFGLADSFTFHFDHSTDSRNALFFAPAEDYETTLRLQFVVDDVSQKMLLDFFKLFVDDIEFPTAPIVVGRKKAVGTPNRGEVSPTLETLNNEGYIESKIIITARVQIGSSGPNPINFAATFAFGIDQAEFVLVFTDKTPNLISGVLNTLTNALKGHAPASTTEDSTFNIPLISDWFKGWVGNASSDARAANTASIILRLVRLIINDSGTITNISVEFEVAGNVGTSQVSFIATFAWPQNQFSITLWTEATTPSEYVDSNIKASWLPSYEPWFDVERVWDAKNSVSLYDFIPGATITTIPWLLDNEVKQLSFVLGPDNVSFTAAIGKALLQSDSGTEVLIPHFELDYASFTASYVPTTKDLNIELLVGVDLSARVERPASLLTEEKFPDAYMQASFDYTSQGNLVSLWTFEGSMWNVKFATMYTLMDPTARGLLMDILEEISISYLNVRYSYDGEDGSATEFNITGVIQISNIAFMLTYAYNQSGWSFSASLGTQDTLGKPNSSSSLKGILTNFIPLDVVNIIPDFCDIAINPLDDAKSSLNKLAVRSVKDETDPEKVTYVLFTMNLTLPGERNLTFAQLNYPEKKGGEDSSKLKRVIRFTLIHLDTSSIEIPIVGEFGIPWDSIDFIYVADDSNDGGLLRKDMTAIDDSKDLEGEMRIPYSDYFLNPDPSDVLLTSGCHLVVSARGKGILDLNFGAAPEDEFTAINGSQVNTAPAMAPLKKSSGPLSISNVGLQIKGRTLTILLDATVLLGPIGFKFIELGIHFDIPPNVTLEFLTSISPRVTIQGLAAGFESPPVTLAGMFAKDQNQNIYYGGVHIGMDPYKFGAVGSYGEIEEDANGKVNPATTIPFPPVPTNKMYKTVFVFGKLDGPIANFGFMEVKGVRIGFGYNSYLRNPDMSDFKDFPLIDPVMPDVSPESKDAQNPLLLLTGYFCAPGGTGDPLPWVSPRDGYLWFALGLNLLAFDLLSVNSIIVVDLQPSVILNFFADAIVAMPGNGTKPKDSFVFVELNIIASMDFNSGTFKVNGKLTPNSFVLNPKCHLSGEFGMAYWFGSSQYVGDWIYSIGGYHPAYHVPSHYPLVSRLAIKWKLDDNLSISGNAYFAISPKACMGGGMLSVIFELDSLDARLNAYADFLINFDPFYYQGQIGVSVNVGYTIDLWFCTKRISCDISARLSVQGPEFGGVVHVDFWVFGFDIHFGPDAKRPGPLTWDQFYDILTQDTSTASKPLSFQSGGLLPPVTKRAAAGSDSTFLLTVLDGSIPSAAAMETVQNEPPITQETSSANIWTVKSGLFKFHVETRFPFRQAQCNVGSPSPTTLDMEKVMGHPITINMKPMQATLYNVSSILSVSITQVGEGAENVSLDLGGFILTGTIKDCPTSVWGTYSDTADPSIPSNNPKTSPLLDPYDATIPLPMGLDIKVPKPILTGPVEKFNAIAAMFMDVNLNTNDPTLVPANATSQNVCLPVPQNPNLDEQWKAIGADWVGNVDNRAGMIEDWKGVFGWDVELDKKTPTVAATFLRQLYSTPMFECKVDH